MRLATIGSALVVALLLLVYRSPRAVLLGLVPVVTGALAGVAAVALVFGAVHGMTLGFGVTLIGEAVDYSIYFFIQSADAAGGAGGWRRTLWPTVRLGAADVDLRVRIAAARPASPACRSSASIRSADSSRPH